MNTTTALQQSIQAWITTQLPHLKSPSAETLERLTQGPAAEQLWNFVTTRVRSDESARSIRATLALSKIPPVPPPSESYTAELCSIVAGTAKVEAELSALRASLNSQTVPQSLRHASLFGNAPGDVTPNQTYNASNQALCSVLSDSEETLTELISNLQTSAWRDHCIDQEDMTNFDESARADLLAEISHLANAVSESTDVTVATSHLTASASQQHPSHLVTTLLSNLQASTDRLRRTDTDAPPNRADAADRAAQHEQLKAFAALRRTQAELARATELVEAKIASMESLPDAERTVRVLGAELAGEKALLAFARRRHDVQCEDDDVLRLRREVARGNAAVRRLDEAAGALCAGNLTMLADGDAAFQDVQNWGTLKLRERLEKCIKASEDGLYAVENGLSELEKLRAAPSQIQDQVTDMEERRRGVSEWQEKMKKLKREHVKQLEVERRRIYTGLGMRAKVMAEERERVLEDVQDRVLPLVTTATKEAEVTRERDAECVRLEMRNWMTEPAKLAAPWLVEQPAVKDKRNRRKI